MYGCISEAEAAIVEEVDLVVFESPSKQNPDEFVHLFYDSVFFYGQNSLKRAR